MKKYNYIANLLEELITILEERKVVSVAWIGVHPWLPQIYQFLIENGVLSFYVMDNDKRKHGNEIWMYKNAFARTKTPFHKVYVTGVKKIENEETLYFMANTHDTEISIQLQILGISLKDIFNFYSLTCDQIVFKNTVKCFSDGHRALSLHNIQQIELDLLVELKKYCENNKLRYFLGGGTLIGAVRHRGFIPWDDDIDVYMPYPDYINLVNNYMDHAEYALLNWRRNDDFPLQFSMLVNKKTKLYRNMDFICSGCELAVFIDIFPISGYAGDNVMIEKKWNKNWELDADWFYYQMVCDIKKPQYKDVRQKIECLRFSDPFDSSKYVGNMIRTIHRPWAVPRRIYDKTIKLEFEGILFDAPSGYEEYLTYRYGDYLELPVLEKREKHLFPAFWL